jgi:hypothetical protein
MSLEDPDLLSTTQIAEMMGIKSSLVNRLIKKLIIRDNLKPPVVYTYATTNYKLHKDLVVNLWDIKHSLGDAPLPNIVPRISTEPYTPEDRTVYRPGSLNYKSLPSKGIG